MEFLIIIISFIKPFESPYKVLLLGNESPYNVLYKSKSPLIL